MRRALTQSQAAELLRAASLLPPATRDQFIAAVDRRLVGIRRQLTDDDVGAAIISVLADTRITTSHFMCDSQQEVSMRNYEVIDRYGNRVERGGNEELRDGERLRVPLHMADSRQREVAEHFERLRAEDARSFGHDDSLALHKPGQRFSVDEAARARVEQARAEGIREMCDAWRKPDANSGTCSGEFRGQQPGDQCAINGAPGHLNHRPECIPDRQDSAPPRTMSVADAQRIRDAAYAESVQRDENAWRGPAR